jgi:radical SAM-linked protein
MSLAAPLPVGVTSEAELMDVALLRWASPHSFTSAVGRQLPPGMRILQVLPIGESVPSLQSQVRFAEYRVELQTDETREDIEGRLRDLLALKSLTWQHQRDTETRTYDLRALVDTLWLMDRSQGACTLGMRLRHDSSGSGRPERRKDSAEPGGPGRLLCAPSAIHS